MTDSTTIECQYVGNWQIANGIAEWWDGEDVPKLVIKLPEGFAFTDDLRKMLEDAYSEGGGRGYNRGRSAAQSDIRRALGIS